MFRDGESIDDFAMRLMGLVTNLDVLGNRIEDSKVVKKFLCIIPPKFSIKEVIGRLKVAEDHLDLGPQENNDNMLLLMEEEWAARMKNHQEAGGSSFGNKGKVGHQCCNKKPLKKQEGGNESGANHDVSRDKCQNCSKMGQGIHDYRRLKRTEEAHITQGDEEESSLLMAMAHVTPTPPPISNAPALLLDLLQSTHVALSPL